MAVSKREKIKLKSSESHYYYYTVKNKSSTPERISLKKYDPTLRKRVEFKETNKFSMFESLCRPKVSCSSLATALCFHYQSHFDLGHRPCGVVDRLFFSVTNGLEKSWVQKLIALTAPIRVTPTQAYWTPITILSTASAPRRTIRPKTSEKN